MRISVRSFCGALAASSVTSFAIGRYGGQITQVVKGVLGGVAREETESEPRLDRSVAVLTKKPSSETVDTGLQTDSPSTADACVQTDSLEALRKQRKDQAVKDVHIMAQRLTEEMAKEGKAEEVRFKVMWHNEHYFEQYNFRLIFKQVQDEQAESPAWPSSLWQKAKEKTVVDWEQIPGGEGYCGHTEPIEGAFLSQTLSGGLHQAIMDAQRAWEASISGRLFRAGTKVYDEAKANGDTILKAGALACRITKNQQLHRLADVLDVMRLAFGGSKSSSVDPSDPLLKKIGLVLNATKLFDCRWDPKTGRLAVSDKGSRWHVMLVQRPDGVGAAGVYRFDGEESKGDRETAQQALTNGEVVD